MVSFAQTGMYIDHSMLQGEAERGILSPRRQRTELDVTELELRDDYCFSYVSHVNSHQLLLTEYWANKPNQAVELIGEAHL